MVKEMREMREDPLVHINEFDCTIRWHENHTQFDHFESSEQQATTVRLCRLNVHIWNIIPPIFLVAGTLGNVLSIIIWSRKTMRRQSQHLSVILIWLAIGDLMVLYTGISRHFLRKASYIQWDIQKHSTWLCKFHEFLVYFSLSFSAWIIVFIAIERCTCVLCMHSHVRKLRSRTGPQTAHQLLVVRVWRRCNAAVQCTRPMSLYCIITLLGLACGLVNVHFFWTRKLVNSECRNNVAELPYFLNYVWPKLDLLFTSVVPCALIIVSTVTLSIAVCCCHPSTLDGTPGTTRRAVVSFRLHDCRAAVRSRSVVSRKSNKITWTLIGISLAFILCVCPTRIFLVIFPSRMPESARYQPEEFFKYRSIWALLLMVEYLTYVINFMIYSLSNERFRKEAYKIFCSAKLSRGHGRVSVSSLRSAPATTSLPAL